MPEPSILEIYAPGLSPLSDRGNALGACDGEDLVALKARRDRERAGARVDRDRAASLVVLVETAVQVRNVNGVFVVKCHVTVRVARCDGLPGEASVVRAQLVHGRETGIVLPGIASRIDGDSAPQPIAGGLPSLGPVRVEGEQRVAVEAEDVQVAGCLIDGDIVVAVAAEAEGRRRGARASDLRSVGSVRVEAINHVVRGVDHVHVAGRLVDGDARRTGQAEGAIWSVRSVERPHERRRRRGGGRRDERDAQCACGGGHNRPYEPARSRFPALHRLSSSGALVAESRLRTVHRPGPVGTPETGIFYTVCWSKKFVPATGCQHAAHRPRSAVATVSCKPALAAPVHAQCLADFADSLPFWAT